MSQCQKPARSFIKDVFSPYVGVFCSEDASSSCQKNHLSFVELLLPFSRLSAEAHIKDVTGAHVALQDFYIHFKDGNNKPPQQTVGLRMLSEAVGACNHSTQKERQFVSNKYELNYPVSTPWFEEYRHTFLTIFSPSEHEYLRHFTACIIVVSSSNRDPMAEFNSLTIAQHQHQQQTPTKLPYWFSSDVCKYYVLIHDCTDGDDTRAEAVYQSMKSKYGVHSCHLLKINSVVPNLDPSSSEMLPDPWNNYLHQISIESGKDHPLDTKMNGDLPSSQVKSTDNQPEESSINHPLNTPAPQSPRERHSSGGRRRPRTRSVSERGCCLSTHDHERLKTLVSEFIVRAFIPWAERMIKSLNEVYQTKKKGGFLKSIFSRARSSDSKQVSVYQSDSSEMTLRRLADLCFMFQLYETAYGVYHLLKKDFESDKAWMFCAGAQEMAGLSVFMQGQTAQRQYPTHYLDGAINVYTSCKSQAFMTRAVLLSTEVLKEKGLWLQAATQFLKLTGEEHDLRSALLLEQTAYCYINMSSSQIRKFAFYLVLAGHRYSKANQKRHALRCYSLALQVYDNKDWRLAEDHIRVTMARLCNQLKDYNHALTSMNKSLVESKQTPVQQATFLKEYLQLYDTLAQQGTKSKHLPEMNIPKVVDNEIMITTETFDMVTNSSVYSDDPRWAQLEEACVIQSQGSLPLVLHRSIPSYNRFMKNISPPRSIINEIQYLRVLLHNPLRVNLQLTELKLEWRFKPKGEDNFTLNSHENPEIVTQYPVPTLEFPGQQKLWVLFKFIPKAIGFLNFTSFSYKVSSRDTNGEMMPIVQGCLTLHVRGQRLNNTKGDMNTVAYSPDKRLFLNISSPLPKIKVLFDSFPSSLQCGEIVKIPITITNIGPIPLHKLHMACNEPALITVPSFDKDSQTLFLRKVLAIENSGQPLNPSESLSFDMWLRADENIGTRPINFLFYYESIEDTTKPRHRCSRHSFILTTTKAIEARCNVHHRAVKKTEDLGSLLLSLLLCNSSPVSQQAAVEFAVVSLLSLSKTWEVSSVNDCQQPHVKINQSEVALLSASLKHANSSDAAKFSCLKLNSDEVNVDTAVIRNLIQHQSLRKEPEDDETESEGSFKKVDAEIAVLWKGYTIDVVGNTTQSLGLTIISVNIDEELTHKKRTLSHITPTAILEFPQASHSLRPTDHSFESNSIEYHFQYESIVKKDFDTKRLQIIPVKLVLQSFHENSVSVEIHQSESEGFMWSGKTKNIVVLPPQKLVTLNLGVTIFDYGVYNLNALEIRPSDRGQVRMIGHTPPLLIVEKG